MAELRVLIDARIHSGASGGVEQALIGVASGLASVPVDDLRLSFLVHSDDQEWIRPFVPPGAQTVAEEWHRTFRWRATGAARRLRRSLPRNLAGGSVLGRASDTVFRQRPDVIHFPTQNAFETSTPNVYQPWDLQHLRFPEFFSKERIRSRERSYRAACRQASAIVVSTRSARTDMIAHYGIDESKLFVIPMAAPMAVHPSLSNGELNAVRSRHRLPDRFALYPASLWRHKNHARLFRALARIRDCHGERIHLVLTAADNQLEKELTLLALSLGISDQISLLGFVPSSDVSALYSMARCLVFPSLFEGFGLPVVEAMYAGLPVVCSDIPSLTELVDDAAMLFDPFSETALAEALFAVWSDERLRERLTGRGRSLGQRYSWERTARLFAALYRHVAGRTAPADEELLAPARR